ncbi:LytR/AlgR family response regulator transcription factor [Maribacter chungangensis]|uniref:LytR/AlgR family response regulator transcription factor n=1 Tax=Maribacter chungangensis TaxID=1069117 RepID=A0ABW3B646_9FLAO
MISILNKPHPFIFNKFSVLVPSAITFLLILLLAPSYFQNLEPIERGVAAFFTTLLVGLCIRLSVPLLKKLLPTAMNEDDWTIGKEILLILSVVCIMIIAISVLLFVLRDNEETVVALVFKTASLTIGISIFPIIITVLFEQYHHQKLQVKKATSLTTYLATENKKLRATTRISSQPGEKLLIKSDNQNIELRLDPNDLIFMKSDGNYMEVYYHDMDDIKTKLIRNTMKSITAVLPNTSFLRCHKSFIVNGNYIIKVEGNARNLELKLKGVATNIPVSRAKVKEVSKFLEGN